MHTEKSRRDGKPVNWYWETELPIRPDDGMPFWLLFVFVGLGLLGLYLTP